MKKYFAHLHIQGLPGCFYIAVEGDKAGVGPNALWAEAMTPETAENRVRELSAAGVPILEVYMEECGEVDVLGEWLAKPR